MDPEGSAKGLFPTGTPHPLSHPGARVRCVSLPHGGCGWLWSFDADRCCWCLSCGAPRLLPPGVFLSFGAPGRSGASARPAVFVFFPSVGVLALVFRRCGASAFSSSWWLRFACVLWPLCGFRSWLVLLSVCLSFSGCGWCLFLLDALGLLGVSVPFGGRGWCLSFRPPGLPLTLWCSSFFWLLWLVLCVWRSGASARPGVSPFVFWCPGASAQPAPMMCLSSLWLLRPEFVLWPSASSAHGCCCV